MKKESYNPVREKGFDSKAQMRYLLHLYRTHPEKYSWVRDALRDHGVPAVDGPLHTYWEPPYNISPDTPSYVYTGGKTATVLNKILKFADRLELKGHEKSAAQLDDAVLQVIEKVPPRTVANTFWALHGNEAKSVKGPEELAAWFDKFFSFAEQFGLSQGGLVEAQRYLGDKILGREVE